MHRGRAGLFEGDPPPPLPLSGAEFLEAPKKIFGPNRLALKAPEKIFDRLKARRKIWSNILSGGGGGGRMVGGWCGTPRPPPPPSGAEL